MGVTNVIESAGLRRKLSQQTMGRWASGIQGGRNTTQDAEERDNGEQERATGQEVAGTAKLFPVPRCLSLLHPALCFCHLVFHLPQLTEGCPGTQIVPSLWEETGTAAGQTKPRAFFHCCCFETGV